MTQKLHTPAEQQIVGPHIRHADPHPQYNKQADADALTARVAVLEEGGDGTGGTATALSDATPKSEGVSQIPSAGIATSASRADHRHAMPDVATTSADGFMSAEDKAILDELAASEAEMKAQFSAENKQGSTISAGMAVATHSSGVGLVLASAADITKPAVGLMVADTLDAVAGSAQVSDVLAMADWTAATGSPLLSAHALYFLSATTPGMLTTIAPSTVGQSVQAVGRALSTTQMEILPTLPLLL